MVGRWALLVLVGCGAPNPLSSAHADCERINASAGAYLARCERPAGQPFPDCSRVWGYAVPEEQIEQCLDELGAAACGMTDWPEPCPQTWVYLPL